MLNIILPFFIMFAVCRHDAINKVQFLALMFAVLLSKLCYVVGLLCRPNYKIYLNSLSILKIAALRHIRLSKI